MDDVSIMQNRDDPQTPFTDESTTYIYSYPNVDRNGVRAMIGRTNMPFGSKGSAYLKAREIKKVNKHPTSGTSGVLVTPKNP